MYRKRPAPRAHPRASASVRWEVPPGEGHCTTWRRRETTWAHGADGNLASWLLAAPRHAKYLLRTARRPAYTGKTAHTVCRRAPTA
eukprot:scaffold11138_cov111-Isochrysis_galbana.AAC.4